VKSAKKTATPAFSIQSGAHAKRAMVAGWRWAVNFFEIALARRFQICLSPNPMLCFAGQGENRVDTSCMPNQIPFAASFLTLASQGKSYITIEKSHFRQEDLCAGFHIWEKLQFFF
jgi:hypothetical protein